MKKERLDILLVERELAETREKAKRIIMTGSVLVENQMVDKPGTKIFTESDIRIKGNPIPYVSRGGLKLEKAIKYFDIQLKNKIGMDIGASTGGFSDCMIQNGVSKVYAIDVGYGQLDWKIRNNSKTVTMERTNIRYVKKEDIGEPVNFISIDVSFISLELVLPVAKELMSENGKILALIKPQFEVGKEKVGKKGVVRNSEYHIDAIEKIVNISKNLKLAIKGLTYSPITGPEGNIEYLILLENDNKGKTEEDYSELIFNTVATSHKNLETK